MISLQQFPFDDLAGAEAVATIPVSDRLVNELVARGLPPSAVVREVVLRAEAGNRLTARVTLRSGFMPPLNITATIDEQPTLPASPILGLRLSGLGGLMGFAGAAVGNMLPPGVRMEGDRVLVNLRTLLSVRGAASLLDHVQELFVTTEEGRIVIACRMHIR